MKREALTKAVQRGAIEWQRHSLERMLERGISREIVKKVLMNGDLIEDYPKDPPFPIALLLGWHDGKPYHVVAAHVVAALDEMRGVCYVITAYQPDAEHFGSDFRTRR